MLHRPRFRRHVDVRVVGPNQIVIRSERSTSSVPGRLLPLVVPLIDGDTTIDEMIERLDGQASPLDVSFAISLLTDAGVVVDGRVSESAATAFLAGLGAAGERRVSALACSVVSLDPSVSPAAISDVLIASGVTIADASDFSVVASSSYFDPRLEAIAAEARAAGRSWLLMKATGTILWVGPLFSRETACLRCLQRRLLANGQSDLSNGMRVGPHPSVAASQQVAYGVASMEAIRWLATAQSPLVSALCTIDLADLSSRIHQLRPLPGCNCCTSVTRSSSPVQLQARFKSSTRDGGHRAKTVEETLTSIAPLISPLTGIVHAVVQHQSNDLVYTASAELASELSPLPDGASARPLRGGGKGMSSIQAQISAIAEALERYSAIFHSSDAIAHDSYGSRIAAGHRVVHPSTCLLISRRQYDARHEWNQRDLPYQHTPDPFDETRAIDWTAGWSLTANTRCDVATAYCYFGYPLAADHRFCRADSNGCAAGTSLEDAILQGLFEVIERDALAIWWYNRIPRPAIDLSSVGNDYFLRLRDRYHRLGRELWVLDITSDLGVPTFVSLSALTEGTGLDGLLLGAGTHVDSAIALGRAVTEMNQFLPGALSGDARALFSGTPDAAFVRPVAESTRDIHDIAGEQAASEDLADDIRQLVRWLADRDLETIVVDQTRSDANVPSVKVIVPGLRLCRARFAPGRLYDVPVAMGWRDIALDETDLNPVHILI